MKKTPSHNIPNTIHSSRLIKILGSMPKCLYCSGVTDEPGKYEKTNIAKIKVNAPKVYLVANRTLSLFLL